MRDPNRIRETLTLLEAIWDTHPDQRFGQLLLNYVLPKTENEIWNQEDDVTLKIIEGRLETIDNE